MSSISTAHANWAIELLIKLIDVSKKNQFEVLNIVTSNMSMSINVDYMIIQSLVEYKNIVSPFIQFYDFYDLRKWWAKVAFRNYYLSDISTLIEMMKNWFIKDWEIWYIPK